MPADRELLAEALRVDATATPAPWFDVENDLIGGRCIRTEDAPPSTMTGHTLVDDVLRDSDAAAIVQMRNMFGEVLHRWESDGRDLIAHAIILEGIMTELGIGPDGTDEEILPRIRQLKGAMRDTRRILTDLGVTNVPPRLAAALEAWSPMEKPEPIS